MTYVSEFTAVDHSTLSPAPDPATGFTAGQVTTF